MYQIIFNTNDKKDVKGAKILKEEVANGIYEEMCRKLFNDIMIGVIRNGSVLLKYNNEEVKKLNIKSEMHGVVIDGNKFMKI